MLRQEIEDNHCAGFLTTAEYFELIRLVIPLKHLVESNIISIEHAHIYEGAIKTKMDYYKSRIKVIGGKSE